MTMKKHSHLVVLLKVIVCTFKVKDKTFKHDIRYEDKI